MENFKIGDLILVMPKKDPREVWKPHFYLGAKDGIVYLDGGWRPAKDDYFFIPFNENTGYMLGTRIPWAEPWEPKFGELVAAKKQYADAWKAVLFMKKDSDGKFVCRNGDSIPGSGGEELYDFCQPLYKHFKFSKTPEKNEGE